MSTKLYIVKSLPLARKFGAPVARSVGLYELRRAISLILRAVGLDRHLQIRRAARGGTYGRLGRHIDIEKNIELQIDF